MKAKDIEKIEDTIIEYTSTRKKFLRQVAYVFLLSLCASSTIFLLMTK